MGNPSLKLSEVLSLFITKKLPEWDAKNRYGPLKDNNEVTFLSASRSYSPLEERAAVCFSFNGLVLGL